ncbi:hypothetical protein IAT40_006396 [Kwoniella sp. CBS 6097]
MTTDKSSSAASDDELSKKSRHLSTLGTSGVTQDSSAESDIGTLQSEKGQSFVDEGYWSDDESQDDLVFDTPREDTGEGTSTIRDRHTVTSTGTRETNASGASIKGNLAAMTAGSAGSTIQSNNGVTTATTSPRRRPSKAYAAGVGVTSFTMAPPGEGVSTPIFGEVRTFVDNTDTKQHVQVHTLDDL